MAVARRLDDYGDEVDSRLGPTKELLHVSMTIEDPRQRLVYVRPINPAFAIAEVIWILSGGRTANFLAFWNKRMLRYCDTGSSLLHGAYGNRLGLGSQLPHAITSSFTPIPADESSVDQLKRAYITLKNVPESRQVVLQIWRSELDLPNPLPRAADVPCNIMSHLLVRRDRLHWLQVVRSNDLFWGLPYNIIQFTCLQEILAGWLGLSLGPYTHLSSSLHAYRDHWAELDRLASGDRSMIVPENTSRLSDVDKDTWDTIFPEVVALALEFTVLTQSKELFATIERASRLPLAYREWISLLGAEALRIRGHLAEANEAISGAGTSWASSWHLWRRSRRETSNHGGGLETAD